MTEEDENSKALLNHGYEQGSEGEDCEWILFIAAAPGPGR